MLDANFLGLSPGLNIVRYGISYALLVMTPLLTTIVRPQLPDAVILIALVKAVSVALGLKLI